jgi:hypothetical protein
MEVACSITVSRKGLGKVRLDPTAIRGEGGVHDPCLSASLLLTDKPDTSQQFASKVSYDLLDNMPVRSLNEGTNSNGLELCFNLTLAQFKALENMRHTPDSVFSLYLEPIIAWNKHTINSYNSSHPDQSTLGEGGWDTQVGLLSDLTFFWSPKIGTLRIDLTEMKWVEKIFPGMGYDHFRLIEVKLLTRTNRLVSNDAVEHFKEAKQDYDKGMYRECLMKCRLIHEAMEDHLKVRSGPDHKLGDAIVQELGWSPGSEQEKYLNGAWKPLYVMANASAHTPITKSLLPADAHIVLISTASLLEYLAQLE